MKMNKQVLLWTAMAFAIVVPLIIAGHLHHQRNNFSCESHITIVEEHALLDSLISYSFNDGVGAYESFGEYTEEGKRPVAVSNKIDFKYWREEGRVILISVDTNELPKKYEAFRKHIPDFYHHRDQGISLQIIPANKSGYLMVYGNTPVIYCKKS